MDEWQKSEIWWFKHTCAKKIREELCKESDLTEENFQRILDKYAKLRIEALMSSYEELTDGFMEKHTRKVADTKVSRLLHGGKIISYEGDEIRILKDDHEEN